VAGARRCRRHHAFGRGALRPNGAIVLGWRPGGPWAPWAQKEPYFQEGVRAYRRHSFGRGAGRPIGAMDAVGTIALDKVWERQVGSQALQALPGRSQSFL